MDEREIKQALEYPAMQATIYQWMEEDRIASEQQKAMDGDIFLCPDCGYWVDQSEGVYVGMEEDEETGSMIPAYICSDCATESF